MDAPEIPIPGEMRKILALAVCAHNRWPNGARLILRQIMENAASDAEASLHLQCLVKALPPSQKFWLATFDGKRKGVLA